MLTFLYGRSFRRLTSLLLLVFAFAHRGQAQLAIGTHIGYDQPLFQLPYEQLDYGGSRYFDVHADVLFAGRIGFRAEYANLLSRTQIQIPDQVFFGTTAGDFTEPPTHWQKLEG